MTYLITTGIRCSKIVTIYRIVMAFDDFEEQRRSVLHVLRKQLQQIAIVVKVHQNAQLLELETPHH